LQRYVIAARYRAENPPVGFNGCHALQLGHFAGISRTSPVKLGSDAKNPNILRSTVL